MVFDPRSTETRDFVRELTNCQGVLQSFIVSLMPGHPDAGDVLQETNLTFWGKIDDLFLFEGTLSPASIRRLMTTHQP